MGTNDKISLPTADVPNDNVCAEYFKALGDPVRLQVVKTLLDGPLSVSDIADRMQLQIANVSHHLRVLHHAGIVLTERDGRFIYYRVNCEFLKHRKEKVFLDFVCCELELR
jgi:DNA-binding transcriptional ArsR family regulator